MQNIIDAIATTAAKLEALAYPDAVILPRFKRSIQLDGYSCGAKSVYCILRYYGIRCTPKSVEKELHTDKDGTDVSDIKRVLKLHGLICRTLRKPGLRDLKAAITNGNPVLVTLYDSEHYSAFFGYSRTHVFVMNPSLDFTEDGVGSLGCAVRKERFKKIWDKWGIEIAQ